MAEIALALASACKSGANELEASQAALFLSIACPEAGVAGLS